MTRQPATVSHSGTARHGHGGGTMGRVHRRTVVKALVVAAGTGAIGACTMPPAPDAQPTTRPTGTAVPSPGRATGTTAPPRRPAGSAPAGRLAVGVRGLTLSRGTDRPLPTTVWYPRDGGPFPLILFSHGLNSTPRDYADLVVTWARAGFVVAAPTYPHTAAGVRDFNVLDVLNQPVDATYVITQLLTRFRDLVDPRRIAAAGHSAGGITTLGMFTANRDDRLTAGVVLAGRQIVPSPFTGPAAPLLFVHGTADATVHYADGRAAFDALTWPKAFLTVTDGGHVATGAEISVVAQTSTDFWRWSLYGDRAAKSRIGEDANRGRLATLIDRL